MRKILFFWLAILAAFLLFGSNVYADWFQIKSKWSGKCLDVDNTGGNINGANVHQWSCGGANQTNQHWKWNKVSTGCYQLISRWSGKCLDVDNRLGNINGANVHQWDCLGDKQANQHW
jgi:hypothetical protein